MRRFFIVAVLAVCLSSQSHAECFHLPGKPVARATNLAKAVAKPVKAVVASTARTVATPVKAVVQAKPIRSTLKFLFF